MYMYTQCLMLINLYTAQCIKHNPSQAGNMLAMGLHPCESCGIQQVGISFICEKKGCSECRLILSEATDAPEASTTGTKTPS